MVELLRRKPELPLKAVASLLVEPVHPKPDAVYLNDEQSIVLRQGF